LGKLLIKKSGASSVPLSSACTVEYGTAPRERRAEGSDALAEVEECAASMRSSFRLGLRIVAFPTGAGSLAAIWSDPKTPAVWSEETVG
jgi:hypothetical protein